MEKKNTHVTYGLITGLATVILGIILYVTGLSFKSTAMQYVSQVPFLIGILMNAVAFSKANDGYVTFGNIFGSCFKASMIVALVMVAWAIIAIFVFPEMKEKGMAMAREQAAKNPKATDEQIEMTMNMMKKYYSVFMIAGAVFGTMLYGAIFSLIGAAIAKKKGEPPITATNF